MRKPQFILSSSIAFLRAHLENFDKLMLVIEKRAKLGSYPIPEKRILTSKKEVGEVIHRCKRTVRRLEKKGILTSYPIGPNQSVFLLDEIQEAIKKHPGLSAPANHNYPSPKVSFSTFNYKDHSFIDVRYEGWKCSIYFDRPINDEIKIKKIVKRALHRQHSERKSFNFSPDGLKF